LASTAAETNTFSTTIDPPNPKNSPNQLFDLTTTFPKFANPIPTPLNTDAYGQELSTEELSLMFQKMNAGINSFDLKELEQKDESFNNFNIYWKNKRDLEESMKECS